VLRDVPAEEGARIEYAFRLCLSRNAQPEEAGRLARFLRLQQDSLAAGAVQSLQLKAPDGVAPAEFAAWTAVARVLMNLDEFITRE